MKGIVKEGQQIQYHHKGQDWIDSDKKLLRNIMINLISNAVKFSENNSTIHINSEVTEEQATISVRDEGIGISEEDQSHLFSSFFRGKNALNIQGTGLGLHIVKRYADLLGGTINLQSKLGEGTTITLQIPINTHDNGKDNSGN
jgi:signal transduction histidine kinase